MSQLKALPLIHALFALCLVSVCSAVRAQVSVPEGTLQRSYSIEYFDAAWNRNVIGFSSDSIENGGGEDDYILHPNAETIPSAEVVNHGWMEEAPMLRTVSVGFSNPMIAGVRCESAGAFTYAFQVTGPENIEIPIDIEAYLWVHLAVGGSSAGSMAHAELSFSQILGEVNHQGSFGVLHEVLSSGETSKETVINETFKIMSNTPVTILGSIYSKAWAYGTYNFGLSEAYLDPSIRISEGFAALHPDYALSFSDCVTPRSDAVPETGSIWSIMSSGLFLGLLCIGRRKANLDRRG